MIESKRYEVKGLVIGLDWFSNIGVYSSIKLKSDSLEELRGLINKHLEDGSLDSGFGFMSLKGALMDITTVSEIVYNEKVFVHKEINTEIFGKLNDKELDFLYECFYDL